MVKHTQTICRQFADELFECLTIFVKLALQELTSSDLLKVTEALIKISQFEFLVMTEKAFLFINCFCH